jgi:hypothetical protein
VPHGCFVIECEPPEEFEVCSSHQDSQEIAVLRLNRVATAARPASSIAGDRCFVEPGISSSAGDVADPPVMVR